MVWDVFNISTEMYNAELILCFKNTKEENTKWMNRKIQMYSDIFLNEGLVYTIGSWMMNVKVLHECQSQK